MKLYNIYKICDEAYPVINSLKIDRVNASGNNQFSKIKNWNEYKKALLIIRNIEMYRDEVDKIFNLIPVYEREKAEPSMSLQIEGSLYSVNNNLKNRLKAVTDLYESMGLGSSENAIDVKIPSTDSFDEYIEYLKEIEFVLYRCPYLIDKSESIKFSSVDVGSNWISFLITGAIATGAASVIVSNLGKILDVAIGVKAKLETLKHYEKIIADREDLLKQSKELFETIRKKEMEQALNKLTEDIGELKDGEEKGRAEKSLEKLCDLLNKGVEFYASIDTPKEVQELFPKMEDKPALEELIKFIEDKNAKNQ